jgi:hypothetical protein
MNMKREQAANQPSQRFPWIPRGYEWVFWAGVAAVQVYTIERSQGDFIDGLQDRDNLLGFAGIGVMLAFWAAIAPGVRAEQARVRGSTYKSWWPPRSFRMRTLVAVGVGAIGISLALDADSIRAFVVGACVFAALIAVGVWIGSTSNSVEFGAHALIVSEVRGGGPFLVPTSFDIPYRNINRIHLKKNGEFELDYFSGDDLGKSKKVSVQILPAERDRFLEDLRSRVEADRAGALTVELDRGL